MSGRRVVSRKAARQALAGMATVDQQDVLFRRSTVAGVKATDAYRAGKRRKGDRLMGQARELAVAARSPQAARRVLGGRP